MTALDMHSTSPDGNGEVECTPSEALRMYIASGGMVALAIERLQKTYPALTEVEFYQLLSSPTIQHDLEQQTRAQLIMRTYEAANEAIISAKLSLSKMDPFDQAKAANHFLTQLDALTKRPVDVNINNIIWEQYLPAEAAAAVRYLMQPQTPAQPNSVIDHNPYIDASDGC
jgi:hypothetical protein